MIDLHTHILPDLDDGAKDWQETLDMCAIALNDGIHTIVATPHVKRGMYTPTKELILSKVAELNTLLPAPNPSPLADSSSLIAMNHDPRAMSHEQSAAPNSRPLALSTEHGAERSPIPPAPCSRPPVLTILPGADNAFEPDILKQIEEGTALCLA
ncbi:MAG TPA: CpsB/CapC family capsule biosynthesis tyrosine phosphatase, partial [Thermodesulfobacteriota bacterium]|nr:CpsB/CapC family capsule biosynthesis tyrosine phosphatase [Thermodesulfobacteriota bacterium]